VKFGLVIIFQSKIEFDIEIVCSKQQAGIVVFVLFASNTFIYNVFVLLLSLYLNSKVILLSGFHCVTVMVMCTLYVTAIAHKYLQCWFVSTEFHGSSGKS